MKSAAIHNAHLLPALNRSPDLLMDVPAPLIYSDCHQEQGSAVALACP